MAVEGSSTPWQILNSEGSIDRFTTTRPAEQVEIFKATWGCDPKFMLFCYTEWMIILGDVGGHKFHITMILPKKWCNHLGSEVVLFTSSNSLLMDICPNEDQFLPAINTWEPELWKFRLREGWHSPWVVFRLEQLSVPSLVGWGQCTTMVFLWVHTRSESQYS